MNYKGDADAKETNLIKNENANIEEKPEMMTLLEKIEKNTSRQARYSRLQFFCAALCVVILAVSLLAVGMRLFPLLDQLGGTLTLVNTTITDMKLAEMTQSVTDLAEAGSEGISDALKQIEAAMSGVESAINVIEGLDIAGLNEGIEKLNNVLEPMAKFFGRR